VSRRPLLPGFIRTRAFPAASCEPDRLDAEVAAEAIVAAGLGRKAERYVPRRCLAAVCACSPALNSRVLGGSSADRC